MAINEVSLSDPLIRQNAVLLKPQSAEGKSTDQQSLVEQCHQLAYDGDEVIELNKHEGLSNTEH